MRLVCPKCAAQYEVAETAIPEAGRDVQCSDCGHGWFQRRLSELPQDKRDAVRPFLSPPPLSQTAGMEPATPPPPTTPPRKPLDENVMAILREEALREAMARRADAARTNGQPLPSEPSTAPQPPAAEPPHQAVQPTASREMAPGPRQVAPDRPVARRGLLPDIEEINSTLTAGNAQRRDLHHPPSDSRSGFRAGFALMMVLVAAAAAAYVLAPRITALLPQSAEVMTAYVGTVDHLRRQLDATVTTAQQRVEALLISVE